MIKWLISWFDSEFPAIKDEPHQPYEAPVVQCPKKEFIEKVKNIMATQKITYGWSGNMVEYGHRYIISMMHPHYPHVLLKDSNKGLRTHLTMVTYEAPPPVQTDIFSEVDEVPATWCIEREEVSKESMTLYASDFGGEAAMYRLFHHIESESEQGYMLAYEQKIQRILNKYSLFPKEKKYDPQLPLDFKEEDA